MQSALPMGGKMAGCGVQQPMITRKIKSGASVNVSNLLACSCSRNGFLGSCFLSS